MYTHLKRFLDIILALALIIGLFPLFFIISIILLNTGEKEIIYRQKRIGQYGNQFELIKFVSMLKDSAKMGLGFHTTRNDPRVTKFGKILRLSKLNELPQLFNILNGSMSFVGPRPLIEKSYLKYEKSARKKIFLNKPGLTGIGSVVFRDEEIMVSDYQNKGGETTELYKLYIFPAKQVLELWYSSKKSFFVDLKILFLTGIAVFFKRQQLHLLFFRKAPWEKLKLLLKNV